MAKMGPGSEFAPRRYNVFRAGDGMLFRDEAGACEFPGVQAAELAARIGGVTEPAGESAPLVDEGIRRALVRLEQPLEALSAATVLDDAAWFARMEDTLAGREAAER